jgi:PadR family transcriptional regulator PadR
MNPTAVYRALRDMEARGWVVSHWEDQETQGPPRRIYEMTDLGDEALRAWSEDLERTRDTIDGLLRAYRGRRSGGNSRDSD